MENSQQACLYCKRTEQAVPLIAVLYQGNDHWICPQHLPILIHKPAQLADILPGIDKLTFDEGLDHH